MPFSKEKLNRLYQQGQPLVAPVAYAEGRRVKATCPHCGGQKVMPNPVEHTQEKRPLLCLSCSKSFAEVG